MDVSVVVPCLLIVLNLLYKMNFLWWQQDKDLFLVLKTISARWYTKYYSTSIFPPPVLIFCHIFDISTSVDILPYFWYIHQCWYIFYLCWYFDNFILIFAGPHPSPHVRACLSSLQKQRGCIFSGPNPSCWRWDETLLCLLQHRLHASMDWIIP